MKKKMVENVNENFFLSVVSVGDTSAPLSEQQKLYLSW